MNFAPEFIDNPDGDTLAGALAHLLGPSTSNGFSEAAARPAELAIAAAFFSPKWLIELAPTSMVCNVSG